MVIGIDYYITTVSKNNELVNLKGSTLNFSAHGWWGKEKYNVAAKNPVRPRKNTAEGGCGGNSAVFLQKIEASPAACIVRGRSQPKSFLFLLGEKIGRAQIRKSEENFFAGWRALASGGGAASFVGGFPKMRSDFVQGMEPDWMIRVLRLGASPLGGQIGENFPRLFGFKANCLRAQNRKAHSKSEPWGELPRPGLEDAVHSEKTEDGDSHESQERQEAENELLGAGFGDEIEIDATNRPTAVRNRLVRFVHAIPPFRLANVMIA